MTKQDIDTIINVAWGMWLYTTISGVSRFVVDVLREAFR